MDRGPADSPSAPPEGSSFELERFTWVAPHLLEVAGTFSALGSRAMAEPFLLVHGPQRSHRLPVLPDSLQDDPQDGRPWGATFAWQEPPVAFDAAELRVGPDVIVELPEPAGPDARDGRPVLPVHPASVGVAVGGAGEAATEAGALDAAALEPPSADVSHDVSHDVSANGAPVAVPDAGEDEHDPDRTLAMTRDGEPAGAAAVDADADTDGSDGAPAGRSARTAFDLHADLLDAQEEVRELRSALQRADEDLARSRQDLQAERARHDGEVGRFKEGLASVRSLAAEALTAERAAAEQLGAELLDAQEALRGRESEFAALHEAIRDRDGALQEAQTALRDAQGSLQGAQDALQARDDALREAYADRDAARSDAQAGQAVIRAREEELAAAYAERDAARAAREDELRAAHAERDAARTDREEQLQAAHAARDAAQADRDEQLRAAFAERDAAYADRDAARTARDAAAAEHERRQDQLLQQITALRDHAGGLQAAREAMERRIAGLETSNRRAADARDELQLAREAADEARLRLERALDSLPAGDGAG